MKMINDGEIDNIGIAKIVEMGVLCIFLRWNDSRMIIII